ncbi:MAG: hypothetical protein H7Y30_07875 [Pyrinomonadaceae bacterium]|nr:hypothetical protein [Pyrinomonadaceae bacterium]
MAEERNLGVARAPEADEDTTKAELQRRMEEARESITQTVSEIKETVTNQYQHVRDSVSEALDWREQYRKRPVAWTLGALGVGVVVGYGLGGAVIGDREDDRDYPPYDETDDYDRTDAAQSAFTDHRSYASHAITGGAYGSSEYAAAAAPAMPAQADSAADSRPSYSSGYEQADVEEEAKPGLMERFKETRAYDRLQEEVGELGNRFMDELATAARTIVLPALFNKIKEMVGVDLSGKQQASATPAPAQQNTRAAAASAGTQSPSQGTGESSSVSERTPQGSESNQQRNTGFGYDDRYERESQLYARSENRAFSAPRSDSAPNATGTPATDLKDTPGGSNS